MKHKNFITILLVIVAFAVRYIDYAKFPVHGETQDELAWTWLGTSLLQGQKPTTWSGTNLQGYDSVKNVSLSDQDFAIVTPYLDNPFLFSLIPGAMALVKGYDIGEVPSYAAIRFPMVLLGTVNVLLLLLVAVKLYSWRVAITSALLYATAPLFVFASRVVVAENALITIMLVAMLLLIRIEKDSHVKWIVMLGIMGGLALLTKIAGLAIVVASCTVLFLQKKYKQTALIACISLCIGSLYPLYGFLENSHLFMAVLSKQSDFGIGLGTIMSLFVYPQLVQKTLLDGWMYLGLFALTFQVAVNSSGKRMEMVAVFSLVWLAFILMATPEVISHGWYKYPLFPLMALGMGALFEECRKYHYAVIFITLLVLFPMLRLFFMTHDSVVSKNDIRVIMALPFTYIVLPQNVLEKIKNAVFTLVFALLIVLNIAVIFSYSEIYYWEDSLYFYPIRQGI